MAFVMKRFQHLARSFLDGARTRAVKSRSRARTLFGRRRCVDITRNVAAVAPERSSLAYGPVVPEEHNSSRSITPRAIISSFQRGSSEVFLLHLPFFFLSLLFVPPTHAHVAGPRRHAYVRTRTWRRCGSYGVNKSALPRTRTRVKFRHFISSSWNLGRLSRRWYRMSERRVRSPEPCLAANCEMLKSRDDRLLVHPVYCSIRDTIVCGCGIHMYTYVCINTCNI